MPEAKAKTTRTRKAGTSPAKGKGQTQSKAAQPAAKKTTTRSAGTRKAGTKATNFTQGQELGVGGTREAVITVAPLPDKGYSQRAIAPEPYPFSKLDNVVKDGDELIGGSFFIPKYDDPDRLLATARKRHKKEGWVFWSRKAKEKIEGKGMVEGKRIWRAPKEVEAEAAKQAAKK